MFGDVPFGDLPFGGIYPPGFDPAPAATVARAPVRIEVEPADPLDAIFGVHEGAAQFAVILRPHYLGDA